jgi:outer membrane protein assembly factor BamB
VWVAQDIGIPLVSSPAVAYGSVYIGAHSLRTYDAVGSSAFCHSVGGSVPTCTPVWLGTTGGDVESSPAVSNGVVYVGADDGKLYAFDAHGVTNCTGASPKTCAPLWTAATGGPVISSPAVANGVVYVGSNDNKLYAFDARGTTGCTGSPKVCAPLWTATTGDDVRSSPAVANGVVYVGSNDNKLYAFDAAGSTGCSGNPKSCAPLWTATTGGDVFSSPAATETTVYVGSDDGKFYAFSATGATNCSGSPKVCTPLWTASTGGPVQSSPAVANGVVYVGSDDQHFYAFDAAGILGCGAGTPPACAPRFSANAQFAVHSSPAVANGMVYIGGFGTMAFALP